MKKILISLFGIILLCSCEKLGCRHEDPADKFVGKYEITAICYDNNDLMDDKMQDIIYITKVDANLVHISSLNKYATIEGDNIFIEKFHIYDNNIFAEYSFSPGLYVNGTFRINVDVCEHNGWHKEYMNVDLIFVKIN